MTKLILIGLALLAVPIATALLEKWQEEENQQRLDILWMADHDRQAQAVKPVNRRMRYAAIGKKNPRRCGNTNRGARKVYAVILSLIGGLVK